MLANSSSDNNLLFNSYSRCFLARPASFILLAFNATNIILLLPLCTLILYHGLKQWRQKRSTFSATVSHSDYFTYHMVIVELIGIFGCTLCFCGICTGNQRILDVGGTIFSLTWYGQISFHILTCIERYLAVVHPVTFLSLRNERGIRIRNATVGCVWLLCFAGMTLVIIDQYIFLDFCLLIASLPGISFCSLSVLCVLMRPRLGEQGGGRERADQSKKRAFFYIMIILGVLILRLGCGVVWLMIFLLEPEGGHCLMMAFNVWVSFPSSLVLPLLFLHRAEKSVCCSESYCLRTSRQ